MYKGKLTERGMREFNTTNPLVKYDRLGDVALVAMNIFQNGKYLGGLANVIKEDENDLDPAIVLLTWPPEHDEWVREQVEYLKQS